MTIGERSANRSPCGASRRGKELERRVGDLLLAVGLRAEHAAAAIRTSSPAASASASSLRARWRWSPRWSSATSRSRRSTCPCARRSSISWWTFSGDWAWPICSFARPGRRPAHLRPGGGDVSRPHRRGCAPGYAFRHAQAPLHAGAHVGCAGGRSLSPAGQTAHRVDRASCRARPTPSHGLRVPHPLPARHRDLPASSARCSHRAPTARSSPAITPEAVMTDKPTEHIVLPGLAEAAEILIDRWGIPHIRAGSERDVFLAPGLQRRARPAVADRPVAQARPWPARRRFWARLSRRRTGPRGCSSTAATWRPNGPPTAPDARSICERFAAGINAYVALTRAASRPPAAGIRARSARGRSVGRPRTSCASAAMASRATRCPRSLRAVVMSRADAATDCCAQGDRSAASRRDPARRRRPRRHHARCARRLQPRMRAVNFVA